MRAKIYDATLAILTLAIYCALGFVGGAMFMASEVPDVEKPYRCTPIDVPTYQSGLECCNAR